MDISSKLPMNPWFFIVLMVSLTAIGAWSIEQHMGWTAGADAAALALQLAWIFQAGMFAFGKADRIFGFNEKLAKQKRLMIGALICLVIAFLVTILGFSLFADPKSGTITGTSALVFGPTMLLVFASFFTLIFQAARILCHAEEKNTGERIFVTCLLFLYLIIGAPFLFRRLKQLTPVEA